jgi:hypothetical protein
MGRSRQVARKLGLAAVSLLVSLLAVEGVLRLAGIGEARRGSPWFAGGSHPRFLFQPDRQAGYALRPGFRGVEVASSGEFQVPVAVDGRGLRDHPHGSQGARGTPRTVLALGDSMTFGEGVRVEETYSSLLERATGARVHNGGVPGYGSPQMTARLVRYAPELRPDLVLVTLQATWDAGRCTHPFVYLEGFIVARAYVERLHLVGGNLYSGEVSWPVVSPAVARLKGHSHLARLGLPALRDLAQVFRDPRRPERPLDFTCSAEALARARRTAEAAGARMVVVLAEAPRESPEEHRADTRELAAALEGRGVAVISLDRLLGPGGAEGLRYPRDGHWNAAGHRRVAGLLASQVSLPPIGVAKRSLTGAAERGLPVRAGKRPLLSASERRPNAGAGVRLLGEASDRSLSGGD